MTPSNVSPAPLFLKHSVTVLSLQQLVDEQPPQTIALPPDSSISKGAANCVGSCAGKKLARYNFTTDSLVSLGEGNDGSRTVPDLDDDSVASLDSLYSSVGSEEGVVPEVITTGITQNSLLDTVTLALWEDCADRGLFRYDVTACATKVVPGVFGFVAQLNEGRATKKRPTEIRVDKVCQGFDEVKFNFKKAYLSEVLYQFEPAHDGESYLEESAVIKSSPNLVLINVSPIEYGHVLLVPRVLDCLPQLVDPDTILLALRWAAEANNPYFRVGFNSLGAYASINHLHFQAYYLAAPFACERAGTIPLTGLKRKRGDVRVSRLANYPVNGFVFEVSDSLEDLAAVVGHACAMLQAEDIPHNLLIADRGARVFLWPQCFAEKQAKGLVPEELLETGVNPAAFEIAGHMVLKRKEDYNSITQDLCWRLLSEVSLSESRFQEVIHLCLS